MVKKIYKSNKRIKKMKKYTKNKRNKLRKTRIKKRNSRKKQLGGASNPNKSQKEKILGIIGTNEFDQFTEEGKTYHLEVPALNTSGDAHIMNPIKSDLSNVWKLEYKSHPDEEEKKCILKIIRNQTSLDKKRTFGEEIKIITDECNIPKEHHLIFIKVYRCGFIQRKGYYILMERGDTIDEKIKQIGISKEGLSEGVTKYEDKANELYKILQKALLNIEIMIDLPTPIIWWDVKPGNSVMVEDDLKFIDLDSKYLSRDLDDFKLDGLPDDKIKNSLKLLLQFSYLSLLLFLIKRSIGNDMDSVRIAHQFNKKIYQKIKVDNLEISKVLKLDESEVKNDPNVVSLDALLIKGSTESKTPKSNLLKQLLHYGVINNSDKPFSSIFTSKKKYYENELPI